MLKVSLSATHLLQGCESCLKKKKLLTHYQRQHKSEKTFTNEQKAFTAWCNCKCSNIILLLLVRDIKLQTRTRGQIERAMSLKKSLASSLSSLKLHITVSKIWMKECAITHTDLKRRVSTDFTILIFFLAIYS